LGLRRHPPPQILLARHLLHLELHPRTFLHHHLGQSLLPFAEPRAQRLVPAHHLVQRLAQGRDPHLTLQPQRQRDVVRRRPPLHPLHEPPPPLPVRRRPHRSPSWRRCVLPSACTYSARSPPLQRWPPASRKKSDMGFAGGGANTVNSPSPVRVRDAASHRGEV